MKVKVIPANRLESRHVVAWNDILRARPSLDSPYFTPDFAQIVAAVRQDVDSVVFLSPVILRNPATAWPSMETRNLKVR